MATRTQRQRLRPATPFQRHWQGLPSHWQHQGGVGARGSGGSGGLVVGDGGRPPTGAGGGVASLGVVNEEGQPLGGQSCPCCWWKAFPLLVPVAGPGSLSHHQQPSPEASTGARMLGQGQRSRWVGGCPGMARAPQAGAVQQDPWWKSRTGRGARAWLSPPFVGVPAPLAGSPTAAAHHQPPRKAVWERDPRVRSPRPGTCRGLGRPWARR